MAVISTFANGHVTIAPGAYISVVQLCVISVSRTGVQGGVVLGQGDHYSWAKDSALTAAHRCIGWRPPCNSSLRYVIIILFRQMKYPLWHYQVLGQMILYSTSSRNNIFICPRT